jgi:hypothetical protein
VIGTLPLAIHTNALIEEPLVRVPGGLSANRSATCKAAEKAAEKAQVFEAFDSQSELLDNSNQLILFGL